MTERQPYYLLEMNKHATILASVDTAELIASSVDEASEMEGARAAGANINWIR